MKTSIKIFTSTKQLPEHWDTLAVDNAFLSTAYLEILEKSAPENMRCFFISYFQEENLVGISLSQFLNLNQLSSFGERDKCLKSSIRNFMLKNICSHVLIIGNNMLTGQNAFLFSDKVAHNSIFELIENTASELKILLKKQGIKVHLTNFKDFSAEDVNRFGAEKLKGYYSFSIQPNMVFDIPKEWKLQQDYIDALSKKYRDQYKRARKKAIDIEKRKLNLSEIIDNEDTINDLYSHVAKNAPFNTFFLAKNHFSTFKRLMKDQFLFYGYFIDNKLIGFNTLVKNGKVMDTYFLGYDESIQREKMLYLNMLYDMVMYSIHKDFDEIILARTALEIKSAVGAKPQEMFGFIKHCNPIINRFISHFFCYLEPKVEWQERNPFK